MAKFSFVSKLSSKEQEDLILELCEALASIKKPVEAVNFIKDILSRQEVEMLAKRLRIARLLSEGLTYEEIQKELRVGYSTVARVSEWLKVSGEGYRMVFKRVKRKEHQEKDYYNEKEALARRHSSYYWPELLVKDLARRADKKQRENLRQALKTVGEKSKIYRRLNKIINEEFSRKSQF